MLLEVIVVVRWAVEGGTHHCRKNVSVDDVGFKAFGRSVMLAVVFYGTWSMTSSVLRTVHSVRRWSRTGDGVCR